MQTTTEFKSKHIPIFWKYQTSKGIIIISLLHQASASTLVCGMLSVRSLSQHCIIQVTWLKTSITEDAVQLPTGLMKYGSK